MCRCKWKTLWSFCSLSSVFLVFWWVTVIHKHVIPSWLILERHITHDYDSSSTCSQILLVYDVAFRKKRIYLFLSFLLLFSYCMTQYKWIKFVLAVPLAISWRNIIVGIIVCPMRCDSSDWTYSIFIVAIFLAMSDVRCPARVTQVQDTGVNATQVLTQVLELTTALTPALR